MCIENQLSELKVYKRQEKHTQKKNLKNLNEKFVLLNLQQYAFWNTQN